MKRKPKPMNKTAGGTAPPKRTIYPTQIQQKLAPVIPAQPKPANAPMVIPQKPVKGRKK